MRITNPEINVILFSNEDVIATSAILNSGIRFFIPSSQLITAVILALLIMYRLLAIL